MNKFDKQGVRSLSEEMQEAMKVVAKKHNVTINFLSSRYSDADATFRFKTVLNAPKKGVLTAEQRNYDLHAALNPIPPRNTVVKSSANQLFELLGWNSRARKYPIVAKDVATNTLYKLGVSYVEDCTIVK